MQPGARTNGGGRGRAPRPARLDTNPAPLPLLGAGGGTLLALSSLPLREGGSHTRLAGLSCCDEVQPPASAGQRAGGQGQPGALREQGCRASEGGHGAAPRPGRTG